MTTHPIAWAVDLSAQDTCAFWDHMCEAFGTRVIQKDQAWEMRASGRVLGALGVMPREVFMGRYTTVWGRRLYPCFEVGQGDAHARWGQVVVCVHEHQHVVQFQRQGFGLYAARYMADSRFRASMEAEAYLTQLELNFWRNGVMPDAARLANGLESYGCRPGDVRHARRVLEDGARALEGGARGLTRANQWALSWFGRFLM